MTGWLKLKYPPDKMQFLDNSVRILYQNFLIYMGDPATILILKKYFSFLQNYSYINILCLILNFARNNQQQLVIFIVKKHKTVITNTKIWKVVHFSVCSKCPEPALTQAQSLFGKLNIALLIESCHSCGRWSHINCRTFLSSSMFSGWVEITCSVQA